MKFDTGTWITIGLVLVFYMRLILLQWGKVKTTRAAYAAHQTKYKGKKNAPPPPEARLHFRFGNMYWTILAFALVVLGVVFNMTGLVGPEIRGYWWIPVSAGVLILTVTLR